jgi:hypothetical protein
MFGSAQVRRSSQTVYCPWPTGQVRMSRARTPARNASAPEPWIRYLYSGDESKRPALFRIAKYSNFSESWYFWATRYPDQCSHNPVALAGPVRSWNGVVRIIDPSLVPCGRQTVAHPRLRGGPRPA